MTVFMQRFAIPCVFVMGLVVPALSVHAEDPTPSPEIQHFSDLILRRLNLMEPVAAYKCLNGIAVANPQREERAIVAG